MRPKIKRLPLKQYRRLFEIFPNIVDVIPSFDMNKNIKFLSNFISMFDTDIEIMLNEGCIAGCPLRNYHADSCSFHPGNHSVMGTRFANFHNSECMKVQHKNLWESICTSNVLYPWDVRLLYDKYKIRKFKLVGRTLRGAASKDLLKLIDAHMMGVEDEAQIQNHDIVLFNQYFMGVPELKGIKVCDAKPYLPNLKYFEDMKYACSQVCGIECNYCFQCAKKLEELYPKNKTNQ